MDKNYTIRLEKESDHRETENLVREAFWNVYRPGAQEHYVLHCLRTDKDFVPELNFVMEKDGRLIAQIIFVKAEITLDSGKKLPILTFGPIGVLPEYKRQGYCKALLDFAIEKAEKYGAGALVITGNVDFYGKSGFVSAKNKGVRYAFDPSAEYLLIKELKQGFLDGVLGTYADPKGYFVCDDDPSGFEKFDSTFPQKQKLALPGQLFN